MTDLDLAAIEQRLAQTRPPKVPEFGGCIRNDPWSMARRIETILDDDVPQLLAEVRRLRAQLDQIDARHQRDDDGDCAACWYKWPCPDHLASHPEDTP